MPKAGQLGTYVPFDAPLRRKQRLRTDDLLARFDDIRRRELLDPSAAELLAATHV